jgi:transcriptional regulator with XRE-family HTH domain
VDTTSVASSLPTRDQCEVARQRLGWTFKELAKKAGVEVAAVTAYEDHPPPYDPTVLTAVSKALEAGGVEFTPSGGMQLTPAAAEERMKRALAERRDPPLMFEYGAGGVPYRSNRHPYQIDEGELVRFPVVIEGLIRATGANTAAAEAWLDEECRLWRPRCFRWRGTQVVPLGVLDVITCLDNQPGSLLFLPEEVDGIIRAFIDYLYLLAQPKTLTETKQETKPNSASETDTPEKLRPFVEKVLQVMARDPAKRAHRAAGEVVEEALAAGAFRERTTYESAQQSLGREARKLLKVRGLDNPKKPLDNPKSPSARADERSK